MKPLYILIAVLSMSSQAWAHEGVVCTAEMKELNSAGVQIFGESAKDLFGYIKVNGYSVFEGQPVPDDTAVNDGMVCWKRTIDEKLVYQCSFLVGADKKLYPLTLDHAFPGCSQK